MATTTTFLRVIVFLWSALAANFVSAHNLPISYLQAVPDGEYLHVELTFNPFELSSFSTYDANKDGRLDSTELLRAETNITREVLSKLKITSANKTLLPETAGIASNDDEHHLTLRAHYKIAVGAAIGIESELPNLMGSSHFTQVTYGTPGAQQWAKLERDAVKAVFAPSASKSSEAKSAPANVNVDQSRSRTASAAFIGLLILGCIPPVLMAGALIWFIRKQLHNDSAITH